MTGLAFDTLLIANRGEIACRIARTAGAMGLRTVAVYSEADAGSPHVLACDVAVEIGPPPASESYLDIDRVIDAARRTNAGAIHPGFGFLAERADFAGACADAGIVFVGPSPEAILAMGDKAAAKATMRDAKVPVLPGYEGDDQETERLLEEAEAIGFPLMIKAVAGGGGTGMRLIEGKEGLPDAIESVRREAESAFGSGVLLLERAVTAPRHVEIQVLADTQGNCVHLGERDCSIQRRHQKVIEESPSPAVDEELRARMGDAGVAAARAVDYVGAGTVEFLLDDSGEFFFLEMNTRLQVEHPVTEMVTGLDLVEWQLRVASGEPLSFGQEEITFSGHAIEARLYAEDPASGYLPSTGTLLTWNTPSGPGVRIDAGVAAGSEISSYYDPMIAKVICHGSDREEARARLVHTLEKITAQGVTTNRAMLIATLKQVNFAEGDFSTAFLELHSPTPPEADSAGIAAVAATRYLTRCDHLDFASEELVRWSSSGELDSRQLLRAGDEEHLVTLRDGGQRMQVDVDGTEHLVSRSGEGIVVDEVSVPVRVLEPATGRVLAAFDELDLELTDLSALPAGSEAAGGAGALLAPMHGRVAAVVVEEGARVSAGDRLLVLEAMKMEHEIVADIDGTVEQMIDEGSQVAGGQLLVQLAPGE